MGVCGVLELQSGAVMLLICAGGKDGQSDELLPWLLATWETFQDRMAQDDGGQIICMSVSKEVKESITTVRTEVVTNPII